MSKEKPNIVIINSTKKQAEIDQKKLIKKLLLSESPKDIQALCSYLYNFDLTERKKFIYDLELRTLALEKLIVSVQESNKPETKKNKISAEENQEDIDVNELIQLIAGFFFY